MILQVEIKAYQKGLLFRKNRYMRLLDDGKYWILEGDQVLTYEMTKVFVPPIDLNILLQDEELAAALEVVEVGNSEIVLQFENGLFKGVLGPGRYAFWRGIVQYSFVKADVSKIE